METNQIERDYWMGVPVDKLPKGLLKRLIAGDKQANMEFALILRAYLKRKR